MASIVRAVRSGDIKLIDAELRKPVRQVKNNTCVTIESAKRILIYLVMLRELQFF